jgi:TMEM175 potassium channel family protein
VAAKTDHQLERLVFFSDAVFAIAITLLVLEIDVPRLAKGAASAAFLPALDSLIPSLFGYVISFIVIGLVWVAHHRAFACARVYRPKVLGWNLGLLGMIALMPWFTAFMSANIRSQLPWEVYCGALTLTAALNLQVVRLATGAGMAGEGAVSPEAELIRERSLITLIGAAAAFALTFALPGNWHFALMAIVVARRGSGLVQRFRRKGRPAA